MAKQVRNNNGQFTKKKLEEPAVFLCNDFANVILTMEPGVNKTNEKEGKKGKRIEFEDGKYVTQVYEEYRFLKEKMENHHEMYDIELAKDPKK